MTLKARKVSSQIHEVKNMSNKGSLTLDSD